MCRLLREPHVHSADGTPIAYELIGSGAPLIVVGGATAERSIMRSTAQALGREAKVVNYDRRGRGASGDADVYAVEREIEDLGALIEAVGGEAAVYGHSSGAGLALRAAAAGLPVTALVLHEPPYATPETAEESRAFAAELGELLAAGRRRDALRFFFAGLGLDPEAVDARLEPLAHTLAYDSAVMGDANGAQVPVELLARLEMPVLVLVGAATYDFLAEPARVIAGGAPHGRLEVLEEAGHVADPQLVADAVAGVLV